MARAGDTLSPETKRKISAAQIRNFKERLAQQTGQPEKKLCARCDEWKPVADFYQVKRRLRSGLVAVFPHSPCKSCKAQESKQRRERLAAEGVDLKALRRKYEQNEDPERRRQRRRENEAARRRKEGRPVRGPYKRPPEQQERLATGPIASFLEKRLERQSKAEIAALTGVDERRIFGILTGEYERVSLANVDAILTGLDCPEELNVLYPPEPEKLVGYHVLDENGKLLH